METCGECKNFIRVDNSTRGKCRLRKYIMSRQKKETNRLFLPYASRTACKQFYEEGTTITNYDRIKNMSVDEMAKFMGECGYDFPPYCDYKKSENCNQNCLDCAKDWLESEDGVMAYIDTKYLFQCETCRHHLSGKCDTWCDHGEEYIPLMTKIPTADVVEVKHGEWYLLDECANEGVYCSVCHKKVYKTDYANQKLKSNYCPNCGAKMDGGKAE